MTWNNSCKTKKLEHWTCCCDNLHLLLKLHLLLFAKELMEHWCNIIARSSRNARKDIGGHWNILLVSRQPSGIFRFQKGRWCAFKRLLGVLTPVQTLLRKICQTKKMQREDINGNTFNKLALTLPPYLLGKAHLKMRFSAEKFPHYKGMPQRHNRGVSAII